MYTKYVVISEERLNDLVDIVNAKMKAGWQPLGAPFMIQHPKGVQLVSGEIVQAVVNQAMVR